MNVQPSAAALVGFLDTQADIGTLRFMTCGSVDDGKSTLIGRLLYDTKLLFDDQLAALTRDSARHGTAGAHIDFALLVDGLEAEREQGITIDVAYRFFTTDRRRFIVADTPGHEQYTRNMATAASSVDLAVVLVDARAGVLTQTRRHSYVASLAGIRHIVLAVNKIDLVDYSQARFNDIVESYRAAVKDLGFSSLCAIPISARFGDNITSASPNMSWYDGPSLIGYLETIDAERPEAERPFRMPVQLVCRPNQDFRGYAGTVAAGRVRPGDRIRVAASGQESEVTRIVTYDGDRAQAVMGEAVTLVLANEIDISRGDVLCDPRAPVLMASELVANVVWLSETILIPGRSYVLRLGSDTVPATVVSIEHRIDINSFEKVPAERLGLNDVALITLQLSSPLAAEPFADSIDLGGFILIDRLSNATVGMGMIERTARPATNITWYRMAVDKQARGRAKGQRPVVVWFTGLSGSGKSTIADLVEKYLHTLGRHTFTLDGDNVRHGLNKDLGFTESDRVENIRRASEAAKLLLDAGLIVLVSFISPYRADRAAARDLFADGEFIEVFVDTPIDECRRRDPKGLYKKADAGLIRNFTGIDAPYEMPDAPDLHLCTVEAKAELLAERVVGMLRQRGLFA